MTKYRIILFILPAFMLSDCPDGYLEYPYNNWEETFCFYSDDINFLNHIMDNNCADYDQNNEYAIIECFFGSKFFPG